MFGEPAPVTGHDSCVLRIQEEESDSTAEDGVEGVAEVFCTSSWYGTETDVSTVYLLNKTFAPNLIGESVFNIAKIVDQLDELRLGNYWAKTVV